MLCDVRLSSPDLRKLRRSDRRRRHRANRRTVRRLLPGVAGPLSTLSAPGRPEIGFPAATDDGLPSYANLDVSIAGRAATFVRIKGSRAGRGYSTQMRHSEASKSEIWSSLRPWLRRCAVHLPTNSPRMRAIIKGAVNPEEHVCRSRPIWSAIWASTSAKLWPSPKFAAFGSPHLRANCSSAFRRYRFRRMLALPGLEMSLGGGSSAPVRRGRP